uniref:Uncharacterized protein n=1 Tax=Percolomonas cosmopolitus TaxID=63605 RepID=A0A7S1KL03_9EUKA|mmetsp:Transcript_10332/g.38362  ORF Transcript_10332/g.38362 Transcript_10332/m.38362 type:complete len:618 (+) Transcript_10332:2-1855(+)
MTAPLLSTAPNSHHKRKLSPTNHSSFPKKPHSSRNRTKSLSAARQEFASFHELSVLREEFYSLTGVEIQRVASEEQRGPDQSPTLPIGCVGTQQHATCQSFHQPEGDTTGTLSNKSLLEFFRLEKSRNEWKESEILKGERRDDSARVEKGGGRDNERPDPHVKHGLSHVEKVNSSQRRDIKEMQITEYEQQEASLVRVQHMSQHVQTPPARKSLAVQTIIVTPPPPLDNTSSPHSNNRSPSPSSIPRSLTPVPHCFDDSSLGEYFERAAQKSPTREIAISVEPSLHMERRSSPFHDDFIYHTPTQSSRHVDSDDEEVVLDFLLSASKSSPATGRRQNTFNAPSGGTLNSLNDSKSQRISSPIRSPSPVDELWSALEEYSSSPVPIALHEEYAADEQELSVKTTSLDEPFDLRGGDEKMVSYNLVPLQSIIRTNIIRQICLHQIQHVRLAQQQLLCHISIQQVQKQCAQSLREKFLILRKERRESNDKSLSVNIIQSKIRMLLVDEQFLDQIEWIIELQSRCRSKYRYEMTQVHLRRRRLRQRAAELRRVVSPSSYLSPTTETSSTCNLPADTKRSAQRQNRQSPSSVHSRMHHDSLSAHTDTLSELENSQLHIGTER